MLNISVQDHTESAVDAVERLRACIAILISVHRAIIEYKNESASLRYWHYILWLVVDKFFGQPIPGTGKYKIT